MLKGNAPHLQIGISALLTGLLYLSGCRENSTQKLNLETTGFTREASLNIIQAQTDSVLANLDIEFADSDFEIQTGLMYREKMAENQAMLFIFPEEGFHSFYMKNTLIPLDILFIKSDSSIVRIAKNAQPLDETGIPSGEPVRFVLEINAGLSERWKLSEGDRIGLIKD